MDMAKALRDVVEAWDSSWDRSGDPGHAHMEAAIGAAREALRQHDDPKWALCEGNFDPGAFRSPRHFGALIDPDHRDTVKDGAEPS